MKSHLTLLLCTLLLATATSYAQIKNNIVITDATDNFTLIPNKEGNAIEFIKRTITKNFMATRAPATAIDYVFYDSFTKINKVNVKAKGVKPIYGSAISAGVFYDDSKVCIVNVPLDEINKPVETRFEVTQSRPDFEPVIYLGDRYPIKKCVTKITMPLAFEDRLDIIVSNVDDNVQITRSISKNGRDWEITVLSQDLPALESPKDAPPSRYIYPKIQFVGQFANPQELYTRLREFTLQPDPDPAAVEAKAIEITTGLDSDSTRIEAIYNWVHENIRYVAIEHGDLGNTPDHASEVLRKRYGDCKGSANLIKAMLNSIGLDGRLVWIGTNSIPDDYTDLPVFATGNHMIAAVRLPGDSLVYLDGTVGMADYGVYDSGIEGKQTIVENGSDCIIGRVPRQAPETNSDITTISVSIDNNTLSGSFCEKISGGYKASFLNHLRDIDPHEREKTIRNYIIGNRSAWSSTDPILLNASPGNGPAELISNIKIDRAVRRAGNKTYITVDLAPWLSNLQFDTKNRKFDGWLKWRRHVESTMYIAIDHSMIPDRLPENVSIDNEWITGSVTYSEDADRLSIKLNLTVKEILVPLERIEEFNNDIKLLTRAANTALVILPNQ